MSPSFLRMLSQARPDPGGGAAAAYAAALGLALLKKVVRLEANRRPSGAAGNPFWREIDGMVRQLGQAFTRLQEEDVQAYAGLARARASGSEPQLTAAVQEAVDCPRRIMGQAGKALSLISQAGERCRGHLVSDLLVACELLGAALRGAGHIARANLPLVKDARQHQNLARELDQAIEAGSRVWEQVRAGLEARGQKLGHCR